MSVILIFLLVSAAMNCSLAAPTPEETSTEYFTTQPVIVTTNENECKAEVSAQCPATDPEIAVNLPDPDDCTSFCECSGGTAYAIHCDGGLYYDEKLHICNWPDNVDCGNRPIPPFAA
ncbi:uncharacterized protein LOC108665673 [Hyalella azteca]|uniref:Uncharacterized protein LOC108665673 n=1 Tax=Hyalella azteca TaxID=294128 RepID=A0A8B7N267_HYAAZ|nr:uncharacterized protein LOC108665673 [Hyalella azteca]